MGFELRENVSSAIISTNITPKNSWDNSGRTDNYIESNAGGGARFGRDFQVLTQARKKMLHFMDDNTVNFFDNNNRKLVANGANATLYNLSGNLGLSASQTLQLFGGSVIDVNANGQNSAQFDNTSVAGETRMLLFDADSGKQKRVLVGANDSDGAGYRSLRVENA